MPGTTAMPPRESAFAQAALLGFLLAVIAALGATLDSVTVAAKLVALVAVLPVLSLGVVFLVYERRNRTWSYCGAAALGAVGIALRFVVNSQPAYEVGGGLPLWVTVVYVGLGIAVLLSSAWAAATTRSRRGSTD